MSTPKKAAKKAAKKVSKNPAKKKAVKKESPVNKELSKLAKAFLKSVNKGGAAGKQQKVIALKPLSQKPHVIAFNHALQSIARTKGMEFDDTSSMCEGDPDQFVFCSVGEDHKLMKRSDCCALMGG